MNRPATPETVCTHWVRVRMPGGRKAAVVCTAPPGHKGRHRDPGIFLDDGRILTRRLAEQVTDQASRRESFRVLAEVDERWALEAAAELRRRTKARRELKARRKRSRR